jgi:glycosyltransferase involved in cell wall biosynthesis
MTPEQADPHYSFWVRVRRALARRFPRTRRAFNWLRARVDELGRRSVSGHLRAVAASTRAVGAGLRTLAERRAERRLTVGVDITALWEPLTGIGWYLYRLLEHLRDRDDLAIRMYGPSSIWSPDAPGPVVELPTGPALELVERTIPEEFILPAGWMIRILRKLEPLLIAADGNDVLFAPNFFLPKRFTLSRGRQVATIHDLGLHRVPWTLRQETLDELQMRLAQQVRRSSGIITVSGAVRDELVELGYAEPSRVKVVHHGPGQLATVEPGPLPPGTPTRFGLHVGTLEPRKNIEVLIEAWNRVRSQLRDCPPLVLCGRYGWKSDSIRAAVERAVAEGWVVQPGYVDDPQLATLYQKAEIVVFPSLYEGFGLPAVEALWAGTPLVCSDLPVLREATGGAALFAPPDDPAIFARQIVSALTDLDLRSDLIEKGRERVAELSWDRAADETAAVWRKAGGHR